MPPVYLLHGLMSEPALLADLVPPDRARPHTFPGHGGRTVTGAPDVNAFANDLAARIEGAGEGPVILFGWSLGATVALTLSLARPDLVAGMVLTGVTPRLRVASDFQDALGRAQVDQLAAGLDRDYPGTCRALCTAMAGGDRTVRDRLVAAALRADPGFARATLLACAGLDLRDRLTTPTVPVAIIAAADDRITPTPAQAWLAGRMTAHLMVLDGGGHAAFLTRPDLFRPAFDDALRHVDGTRAKPH